MEKIIQLKESEYLNLFAKASLNESEIEKMAIEMYEKKGTFGFVLSINCKQDYYDQFSFKAHSYMKSVDGKITLSEEDENMICEAIDSSALKMMKKKFGKQISDINIWNERLKLLRNWKMKFIGLTIFGWLAALSLLALSFLN